ncbi:MAG: LEA type 2 family protein [Balneola sp.]
MTFIRNTPLLIAFIFLTSSCSAIKDIASIKKPSLSISDVQVSNISLQDIELTFDIDIENPNAVSINLDSYNFDFLVDNNSFVKGDQPLTTEIKSTATSTIQIPVSFTFNELYQTFSSIKEKDETAYELDAIIAAKLPVLGLTEIPVKKSGTFPIVKPPKISAPRLSVKNLSFTKAELELQLNIDNPNNFGVTLNKLDYKVDINGLKSVSGMTSSAIDVSKKGSNTITVPVSFNLIELGRSAYQLLSSNKPLDYSISGSTNFDATLPFFDTSNYTFDRTGSLNIFNN